MKERGDLKAEHMRVTDNSLLNNSKNYFRRFVCL